MRSYTNTEQSKKLAEILPLESADMWYWKSPTTGFVPEHPMFHKSEHLLNIPAWSLSALLDLLPNNEHIETTISRGGWEIEPVEYLPNTWWCEYEDTKN